jgi:hypothetical protein
MGDGVSCQDGDQRYRPLPSSVCLARGRQRPSVRQAGHRGTGAPGHRGTASPACQDLALKTYTFALRYRAK